MLGDLAFAEILVAHALVMLRKALDATVIDVTIGTLILRRDQLAHRTVSRFSLRHHWYLVNEYRDRRFFPFSHHLCDLFFQSDALYFVQEFFQHFIYNLFESI